VSAVQQSVSAADPLPRALRACVQSARDLPLPVYALRAPFQNQAAGRAVRQTALLTAPCEALGDLSLHTLVRREMERLENLRASARDHRTYSARIVR
jgi:hypothetical protein